MTDEQLALKAKVGDKKAETELLERYKGIVRGIVRKFFFSAWEYDDLIQEGTIALTRAIQDYTDGKGCTFKSFAGLCIKRRIIDEIRKECSNKSRARKNSLPIEIFIDPTGEENSQIKEIEAEGSNPEEILIKQENYDNLLIEIKNVINENEYLVLEHYLEGLTYRQIAEITGFKVKFVDNAIQRIRKKIAKVVSQD